MVQINFDKVPDLLPLCLAFVCSDRPREPGAFVAWEVLPPPKGRMWVDANVALGRPGRNPSLPNEVSGHPPSIQRKYLVLCRDWPTPEEYLSQKTELGDCVEAVAVGVWGQHVRTEAETDCIESLLDNRGE